MKREDITLSAVKKVAAVVSWLTFKKGGSFATALQGHTETKPKGSMDHRLAGPAVNAVDGLPT